VKFAEKLTHLGHIILMETLATKIQVIYCIYVRLVKKLKGGQSALYVELMGIFGRSIVIYTIFDIGNMEIQLRLDNGRT